MDTASKAHGFEEDKDDQWKWRASTEWRMGRGLSDTGGYRMPFSGVLRLQWN